MACKRRRFCLVPSWWTTEDIQNRTCGDGSHSHITRTDAQSLLDFKEGEWFIFERVIRLKRVQKNIRDLSAKVGDFLAKSIRQRKDWALAFHAQMQTRRELGVQQQL